MLISFFLARTMIIPSFTEDIAMLHHKLINVEG